MESIDEFINGLKSAKNIYAECPSCGLIFSLHSSRLFYGKEPPKDMLSKSQRQIEYTLRKLEAFEEKYEIDKEAWQLKTDAAIENWRNKLVNEYAMWDGKERMLKEKIRHIKSDVAAAQKEIIKEKVDKALLSQRGVIEGHIAELFPLFRKTKINPADLCALIPTSPLDFILFEGLFQKDVTNIIFLDIKKGSADLTQTQKQIRYAVKEGNVGFKVVRVNFEKVKGNAVEE